MPLFCPFSGKPKRGIRSVVGQIHTERKGSFYISAVFTAVDDFRISYQNIQIVANAIIQSDDYVRAFVLQRHNERFVRLARAGHSADLDRAFHDFVRRINERACRNAVRTLYDYRRGAEVSFRKRTDFGRRSISRKIAVNILPVLLGGTGGNKITDIAFLDLLSVIELLQISQGIYVKHITIVFAAKVKRPILVNKFYHNFITPFFR